MEKLSQEDIEFIKQLSIDMKSQDNRMTATPYSYRVQQDVKVYGDESLYANKGVIIEDERHDLEEAFLKCKEMVLEFDWEPCSISNEDELEQFLNDNDIEHSYYSWTIEERICHGPQGGPYSFLTEKACHDYIVSNKHNLFNPKSYVVHEYRNPQMDKLQSIIHKLAESL